jgi:hypothetical protein
MMRKFFAFIYRKVCWKEAYQREKLLATLLIFSKISKLQLDTIIGLTN